MTTLGAFIKSYRSDDETFDWIESLADYQEAVAAWEAQQTPAPVMSEMDAWEAITGELLEEVEPMPEHFDTWLAMYDADDIREALDAGQTPAPVTTPPARPRRRARNKVHPDVGVTILGLYDLETATQVGNTASPAGRVAFIEARPDLDNALAAHGVDQLDTRRLPADHIGPVYVAGDSADAARPHGQFVVAATAEGARALLVEKLRNKTKGMPEATTELRAARAALTDGLTDVERDVNNWARPDVPRIPWRARSRAA